MEIFPENLKRFWNGWEIRMLVLLSLTLQTILTLFASRRKYTVSIWLRVLVWLAYLSADWVATVVLGNLATSDVDSEGKSQKPKPHGEIHAFWAPFLLLHLGGPDTITAYSLEDNELWLRHFLALVVQVTVSIYVFLRFWTNTVLTFMAIPIFAVASLKYGERTLALRFASSEQFKEFLLSGNLRGSELVTIMKGRIQNGLDQEEACHPLVLAYLLLKRFAFLFTGQLLDFSEEEKIYNIFKKREKAEDTFHLVELELGFMYDLLYTKAGIVYSRFGILLRFFNLLLCVSVFIVFSIVIDFHAYPVVDIFLTYLLLVVTIVLEIYTFILHFFSDWISLHFSSKPRQPRKLIPHPFLSNHKRWSKSLGQFNLIRFCTKEGMPTAFAGIDKLLGIKTLLENHRHLTWEVEIVDLLKTLIYNELLSKIQYYEELRPPISWTEIRQTLLAKRGNYVLSKYEIVDPGILHLTGSEAYSCSLISWHIATDICYHNDLQERFNKNPEDLPQRCKISKCLSDYMMYLIALCPTLIPEGSEIWFKQTCEHFIFSRERGIEAHDQLSKIREENAIPDPSKWKEMTVDFPSAVGPGFWISDRLQLLESKHGWSNEKKWKMISELWVEILTYAATHSAWYAHGQYLRRGGELITLVRLLMAHLGLSDQYKTT